MCRMDICDIRYPYLAWFVRCKLSVQMVGTDTKRMRLIGVAALVLATQLTA